MATEKKLTGRHLNFVHSDEIWKVHVRHENVSQRHQWPATWGYIVEEYRKMNNELDGKPVFATESKVSQVPNLPRIPTVPPRPKDFPETTSQEIGWRSANAKCALEIYGQYSGPFAKGKNTLIRRLNWPQNFAP